MPGKDFSFPSTFIPPAEPNSQIVPENGCDGIAEAAVIASGVEGMFRHMRGRGPSIQPDRVVPGKSGVKRGVGRRPAFHESQDIELVLTVDIEKFEAVLVIHKLPDGLLLQ